ncbi:MAG: phytoene desaturase [Saprospiraceae bacterium]|nr:phytoene desaturase [Saprospiraceae bacterium]
MKTVGIIGSGFSGLAAAACLAKAGFKVTVLEKNSELGGRCRKFEQDGFVFDMGPSWYWMPDVFEQFFNIFGKKSSDYYDLKRLDPSYDVIFGKDDTVSMPADYSELKKIFDSIEPGSSTHLDEFLKDAEYKYNVGMNEFVWKAGHSIWDFADVRVFVSLFKLQMLSSIAKQIDKSFKNEKLRNILKFPVLFLGATPENTPALYSLMNYADIKLGTWYPMGGMFKIIDAFVDIGLEHGVTFITGAEASSITIEDDKAKVIMTSKGDYSFDYIVASADYHHVDQHLLPERYRNYTTAYWDKRTMAPSSLLFYLGLNIKLKGVKHHNLYFDKDFSIHAHEIYTEPSWPSNPLFYMCCPSVTDPSVAPDGYENVFILMPLAPGLQDNDTFREKYFDIICNRLLEVSDINIKDHIIYKKSFCVNDFVSEYNAFKGNAYGLANTLSQTAFLKPKLRNKKLVNLYYTGQLTTPGPGMPPSIISGQVVANEIIKSNKV